MYAVAIAPLASARSRREAAFLATILAGHVLLVVALNQGLRLGPLPGPLVDRVQTRVLLPEAEPVPPSGPPGPAVEIEPPRPLPLDIDVADPAEPAPVRVADDRVPGAGEGPVLPVPPLRVAPRPDPRLVAAGRWNPPMPSAVQRQARRAGELGTTLLRCVVAPDGRCAAVLVLASSGDARLDAAAQAHARRVWRFSPGTVDGRPEAADYDLRIRWRVVE